MLLLPRHLEGPEQPDASEDGQADRRHDLLAHKDELHDRGDDHHKVEPKQKGTSHPYNRYSISCVWVVNRFRSASMTNDQEGQGKCL